MGRANSRGQCTVELLVAFLVLITVMASLTALSDRQRFGDLQRVQLSTSEKK